ncbi:hypothetical protein BU17DRAFT_18302, partial [Hysterangium stoloniferum]
ALDGYSQRPDCFRKSISRIRTHCSELDMAEAERVQAAIYMTLCELSTANYNPPPLECFTFTSAAIDDHTIDSDALSNCVGLVSSTTMALSRSAQFWSSYSGYLREVRE